MGCGFGQGNRTVVAKATATDYFIMIRPNDRAPGTQYMTCFTPFGSINMPSGFTTSDDTVVAFNACTVSLSVIYCNNGCPGNG